jgi:hypothetical protein
MFYNFIQPGSIADRKDKELYLDVGNKLEYGVIDHHHLNIQKSATALTFENPQFIPQDTKTIILHKNVDLDCVASSYLAEYYIKNKKFPDFAKDLCEFADVVDFGKRPKSFVNLNSIFMLRKTDDLESVKIGHYLIEKLAFFGFDGGEYPDEFKEDIEKIKSDYKIFQEDLKKSKEIECVLPTRNSEMKKVKGLILFKPKSLFFKYFARDLGYELLIVKWSDKRTVISLKADSIYTLKGMGERLNKAEKGKREKLGIKLNEPNRPGYNMPDPWYDGRGHNYTIIDSPRMGTVLDFDEILDIVC